MPFPDELRRVAPEKFNVPGVEDRHIEEWVSVHEKRGDLVGELRKLKHFARDDVEDRHIQEWVQVKRGMHRLPSTEPMFNAQDIKDRRQAAIETQRAGWQETLHAREGKTSDATADKAVQARTQQAMSGTPAPGEESFIPTVNRYEQLEEMQRQRPGTEINIAKGTGTAQLQDSTSKQALAQTRWGAQLKIPEGTGGTEEALVVLGGGFHPAGRVMGAALRSIYNPDGPGAPERSEEDYRAWMQKTGRNIGREAPRAAEAVARTASIIPLAFNAAGEAKNKAIDPAMNATAVGFLPASVREATLAQMNAQDAKEGREYEQDRKRNQRIVMGEEFTGPDKGAQYGEQAGVVAGDVANVFDPTEIIPVGLGAAGKMAAAAGRTRAGQAVGRSFGDMAEAVASGGTRGVEGSFLSPAPAKVGAPTASRAVMEAAQAHKREYSQLAFNDVLNTLDSSKYGGEDVARKALQAWHDPALRRAAEAADPRVGKYLDDAQQVNWEIAQRAGVPANAYNPLHVYAGQDPGTAARIGRSAAGNLEDAQREKALGILKRGGVDPASVDISPARLQEDPLISPQGWQSIPGVRALGFEPVGMRVADSADQRIANMVAGQIREGADKLSAEPSPLKRWWRQATGEIPDESDLVHAVKTAKAGNATSGMAESARRLAARDPRRIREAVEMVLDPSPDGLAVARKDYGPMAFTDADATLSAIAQRVGYQQPAGTSNIISDYLAENVGVYGKMRSEVNLPPAVARELRRSDMVVVVPRKAASSAPDMKSAVDLEPVSRDALNTNVMRIELPGIQKPMVVPRRYAYFAAQMTQPARPSDVRLLAEGLNHFIGGSQAAYKVTQGRPGFVLTNSAGEWTRGAVDQGITRWQSKAERARSAVELANPQLRRGAEELLGIGKNIGGRQDVFEIAPRAAGALPSKMREWQDRAFGVTSAPGRMANEASDAALGAAFMRAPTHYSVSDRMRFHHWRLQVRNGIDPLVAAQSTNRLFINYADKSEAEGAVKVLAPFIRFYTGALQGAALLAFKEPQRFYQLYRVANAIRNYGGEEDGKNLNAKAISARDQVLGIGHITMDGKPLMVRPEQPLSEGAAVVDLGLSLAGQQHLLGDKNRGSAMFPPAASEGLLPTLMPGAVESATGFNPMNAPTWMTEGRATTLPGRAAELYGMMQRDKTGAIGQSIAERPEESLLWDVVRHAPGIGAVVPTWGDALMRQRTGAQNMGARTPESADRSLQRLLIRSLTGLRTEDLDPQTSMNQKGRAYAQPEATGLTDQEIQEWIIRSSGDARRGPRR